jgi:phenylalanyl-tRNA synthetase beta chain
MYGDKLDFFALKGMIEELLTVLDVTGYDVAAVKNETAYHPGRCAELTANGKRFALLGEIHPLVAENYGIEQRVYAARLDMAALYELSNKNKMYHPLPKFPAVTRDLALLCDESVTVGQAQEVIAKAGGKLLRDVQLFDIYRGTGVPEGKKSLAFSLILRADDRTLTDTDSEGVISKVLSAVQDKLGATLR